jgi:hypothetical protein
MQPIHADNGTPLKPLVGGHEVREYEFAEIHATSPHEAANIAGSDNHDIET